MLKSISDELTEYFKKYQIIRKLGEGGMGVVYQVFDPQLNRNLAVKVISSAGNSKISKRFLREVEITAQLDHPNIVKVYNSSVYNGKLFMVMEYIEGQTLKDHLETSSLSISQRVEMMIAVAKAIHYAHEKDIIHRDLKPDNIIVKKDGTPYLMDFGVAKMRTSKSLTATHESIGTPLYMSPEQANGSRKIDLRSDIYSFGVILYEVLCGHRMVAGDSTMNVLYNVINEKPVRPTTVNDEVPQILEDVCLKAVEKKKNKRYATMQELIADLQQYLNPQSEMLYFLRKKWSKYQKPCYIALILCFTLISILFVRQKYQAHLLSEYNKNIEERSRKFQEYVKNKQYNLAMQQLRKLSVSEDDYNYQLAHIMYQMGQREALETYEKIASPPKNDFLFRGKLLFLNEMYEDAIDEFEKQLNFIDRQYLALESDDKYAKKSLQESKRLTLGYMGESFFHLKIYDEAIKSLEETTNEKGFFLLGSSYFFKEEYSKAILFLNKANEKYAKNYHRCFRLAQCLLQGKAWKQAIPLLSICIDEQPWQAKLYKYRGQAYYDLGDYENSYNDFVKLSQLDAGTKNYNHGHSYVGYFLNIVISSENPKDHHKFAYRMINHLKGIYAAVDQDLLAEQKRVLYKGIVKPQFAPLDTKSLDHFIDILQQKNIRHKFYVWQSLVWRLWPIGQMFGND
ncbi:protein kinase [Candidatus Uabimicrobium amorphum]|uniref:non-specific serine/threonine protein kinase n=1 Tax=Uabimicrobium amorphum TaxID=2596890 RepID=A0A5S9F4D1_UABAM|nr:serine/threonine-protein kinase [Candidatus Uabimicrobium amorphum]BBM85171.1 protein kinase [Candidatus Uabimicrobium amorphum]